MTDAPDLWTEWAASPAIEPNDVLAELRAMWWRFAAVGVRLPAQRGVILIDGRG